MSSLPLPDDFDNLSEGISKELYENVLPFWSKHSHDERHGGFFACLDKNGEVYDTRKFMWLNGRQIWMFARICSDVGADDLLSRSKGVLHASKLLEQAVKAADFALQHAVNEKGFVYFSLNEEGMPYHFERKMFSTCFLCIGLGALSCHSHLERASTYRQEARKLLTSIVSLSHDASPLGRESCAGAPATSPMNVPMILLNVIDEMRRARVIECDHDGDGNKYNLEEDWCISEILKHTFIDEKRVLENVSPDGSMLPGFDGRHMNPGHAIEAGWFILSYADRHGKEELLSLAANMIDWSFDAGWDPVHGGLYYFLDCEGRSPPFLEWNMKLW